MKRSRFSEYSKGGGGLIERIVKAWRSAAALMAMLVSCSVSFALASDFPAAQAQFNLYSLSNNLRLTSLRWLSSLVSDIEGRLRSLSFVTD